MARRAVLLCARVGLTAGLLATLGALLTLDAMVVLLGDLAWRLPDSAPADAARQLSQVLAGDASGGLLWLAVPLVAGVQGRRWLACFAQVADATQLSPTWSAPDSGACGCT